MSMLAEIMTANSFAEIMFLVGFILFVIEVVRLIAARTGVRGIIAGC